MNTASCKSAITFIDGDKGILRYRGYPIEQLAEKCELPRGRVAAAPRRAAERRTSTTSGCTTSRTTRTCTRTSRRSSRASATTRTRCRCCAAAVAALSSFYPEAKNILDPDAAQHLDHPAAREGPDDGGVLLSPHQGAAVHLSRQRPRLRRELPVDGRADARAEVRGESGLREGARGAVHPARRSRAELLDERRARRRLVARRSVLGGGGRRSPRSTVRCTAARTSRCSA